jgi:PAS domain S-box-containing protein
MTSASRWGLSVAAVAVTGVALVLAFVLSQIEGAGGLLEPHFVWLFWVNVVVALLLAAIIGFVGLRLLSRLRLRKFGSRLLLKLAGILAIVGFLPGIVIYTVSYQFVARSIEVWFDAKVAGALDAGLALGKGTLEALQGDLLAKSRVAAERLAETGPNAVALERVREQLSAGAVSLVASNGQIVLSAAAGGGVTASSGIAPQRPAASLLRQARAAGVAAQIDGLDEETLQGGGPGASVRALVRMPRRDLALTASEEQFLLSVNALAVQAAYSDYQQRAIARDSLRRMYLGTLTLALILAVFAAVLLAIVLGNQLVRPLILLADGVNQVAAGDLTDKPVFASADELGGLTRSFADMTRQLRDARGAVQRGVTQLEGARTRLQTILDTLSAGVIVFDRQGAIDNVNPGATRILRLPLASWRGRTLRAVPELQVLAEAVTQRFELLATSPEAGERDHWQEGIELQRADGTVLTLLMRGALLPGDSQLLVFDDISEVVSAQRSQAWAEVARRLAHEIKNPLTPIQLSAQRLQHRLEAKLEGADRALLLRGVSTIVAQVQAMQTLVNEFRDYARLPGAELKPLDLSQLVAEVLSLYAERQETGQLQSRLSTSLPRIQGDPTQLRQVIHNLVQNAFDAAGERADALVRVVTSAALDESGQVRAVRLAVIDNGPGFAEKVLKRALEPYVTTKAKGTGLGLAVVKKIADDHGARVSVANLHASDDPDAPVTGARVSLSFSRFEAASPAAAAQAPRASVDSPPDGAHQVPEVRAG